MNFLFFLCGATPIPFPELWVCGALGLSHSGTSRKKPGRLLYVVPIVAVLIVAGAFAVAYVLPPPRDVAMGFDVAISIQISNGTARSFFVPPSIGVPGGTWVSHRYDIFGVDGRYPLYTVTPPSGDYPGFSLIHVRSRVLRNYTLADFFEVYGQPLGPANTLGLPTTSKNVWEMCVGQPAFRPGNWGSEVLSRGLFITMVYRPLEAFGCL